MSEIEQQFQQELREVEQTLKGEIEDEQANVAPTVLLPCPFCGGAVRWCSCGEPPSEHAGCHQITCERCGNFDFANGHLDGEGETLEDLRQCMADKYNTRCR